MELVLTTDIKIKFLEFFNACITTTTKEQELASRSAKKLWTIIMALFMPKAEKDMVLRLLFYCPESKSRKKQKSIQTEQLFHRTGRNNNFKLSNTQFRHRFFIALTTTTVNPFNLNNNMKASNAIRTTLLLI